MTKYVRHAIMVALCSSLILFKTIPAAQAAPPFSELAAGPDIGTTGIGLRLSTPILADRLNLTAGYSGFAFSYHASADGQPWNAHCRLGGAPVYLSAYPLGPAFHLDAGIFINQTRVSFTANIRPGDIRSKGQTFVAADPEHASGETHYNTLAPYFGIGWGNPFFGSDRWTYTANAGVFLEGGAKTRLQATDETSMHQVPDNVANSERIFNHDMSFLTAFPVVDIGLTYRF